MLALQLIHPDLNQRKILTTIRIDIAGVWWQYEL